MTWTRKDFEAVADLVLSEYPLSEADTAPTDYYGELDPWKRGAYDLWNTTRLALADLCADRGGLNVNGNRRFDRERFLARTDAVKRDRVVRALHVDNEGRGNPEYDGYAHEPYGRKDDAR